MMLSKSLDKFRSIKDILFVAGNALVGPIACVGGRETGCMMTAGDSDNGEGAGLAVIFVGCWKTSAPARLAAPVPGNRPEVP